MRYIVSAPKPSTHFIELEMNIDKIDTDELFVQLPSWRPGRYELGNFAKNIQKFNVMDEKGKPLSFRKITKDKWNINCTGSNTIHIHYNYYAAQLDAGGCWLDEDQLYFNPIHCFLYVPGRIHEECMVEINSGFSQIATSLKQSGKELIARDYHELADSPVIASNSIAHQTYEVGGVLFHLWIQGNTKPDPTKSPDASGFHRNWEIIIPHFKKFAIEQLDMMKEFPFTEYHFLIQALPVKFYHGVEHLNSSVLAIGPGYRLMSHELYTDFIGLASHELFHAWNVKSIRPVEMMPYDYTKENYTRLGFVAEGVTTYYGDLFLLRCGVYNMEQYFAELNVRLQKHFDNYGRFNLSVADSSFDTWLDGYVPGIPDRKTSIYDEGCLIALMTDLLIRRYTQNRKSLDDVMRILYYDFAKRRHGYTEQDYVKAIENAAGMSFKDFFADYVFGTKDYEPLLRDLLKDVGCNIRVFASKYLYESLLGFRVVIENGLTKVSSVAPGSPAYIAGLTKSEEIVAINNLKVENNLDDILHFIPSSVEKITLHVFSLQKKLRQTDLKPDGNNYYSQYKIEQSNEISPQQKESFHAWTHLSL